jgi:hypothetical protein
VVAGFPKRTSLVGRCTLAKRNEENSEQDDFFTSEDLGTNLTDGESEDNRN